METFDLAALLPPDHDQQKQTLKKYVDSMPTFSPATAKILQLANQLTAQPAEIVAAIRLDPVLTGRVLQLLNSAYFSLAQKITSLNRAVVYLGINTIKNLALSTAVMQAFETKNQELTKLIRPAWYHSLATAVCAKSLARAAGEDPKLLEEYFITGLLHDVGKIIFIQAFYGTRTPHDGTLPRLKERELYGLDHVQVTANTLSRWKFSDELVSAVGTYPHPPAHNRVANLLHVADAMTYHLGLNGEPAEDNSHPVQPAAYGVIGLTADETRAELASTPEQIEKAEIFLNIASSKERVVEHE
jgi:putative nucleotidyltransferase with HDIG domain